jgi:ribose 5-phosphate isomerase B
VRIYIGADHNGYGTKAQLLDYLARAGYQVEDEGDDHLDPEDDFPVFAAKTVQAVLSSEDPDPRGILLCGSGQGMCMAANRFKGVRASLCWDRQSAREARNDDNSNILCLPAKVLRKSDLEVIVETWLNTPFASAPRFIRRLQEIDNYQ